MPRKVIGLGTGNKLVLTTPGGKEVPYRPADRTTHVAYVLLDVSGSMAGEKLLQARDGAYRFAVSAADLGYAVGMLTFNSAVSPLCEPSSSVHGLQAALAGVTAGGGTDMTAAFESGTERLTGVSGERALIVVTDG